MPVPLAVVHPRFSPLFFRSQCSMSTTCLGLFCPNTKSLIVLSAGRFAWPTFVWPPRLNRALWRSVVYSQYPRHASLHEGSLPFPLVTEVSCCALDLAQLTE